MSNGLKLKWCLPAIVLAIGCAELTSDLGHNAIAADRPSQASVDKASNTPSIGAAPSDDQLAGRVRRRNRRAYRRMV